MEQCVKKGIVEFKLDSDKSICITNNTPLSFCNVSIARHQRKKSCCVGNIITYTFCIVNDNCNSLCNTTFIFRLGCTTNYVQDTFRLGCVNIEPLICYDKCGKVIAYELPTFTCKSCIKISFDVEEHYVC